MDGTYLGDWVGPGNFSTILGPPHEPVSSEKLYQNLRALDADFLLYTNHNYKNYQWRVQEDEFFKNHFELVKENAYRLYRLKK